MMLYRTLGCLALWMVSHVAAAVDIACPNPVVTTQALVKQEPGWTEFVRPTESPELARSSYVSGISLYVGNPMDIAQLKPDDEEAVNVLLLMSVREPVPVTFVVLRR